MSLTARFTFLELRDGYACGWCSVADDRLFLQPHPGSHSKVRVYNYPGDVDVVGQVIGVAMFLESRNRRYSRTRNKAINVSKSVR